MMWYVVPIITPWNERSCGCDELSQLLNVKSATIEQIMDKVRIGIKFNYIATNLVKIP